MKFLDKEKLIQEVRDKGVEIDDINELKRMNFKYRDLVIILLNHLIEVEDENDKEFLVRCLGVKGFVEASRTLINEFYKSENLTFKWAIGNTLSIIQDESIITELIKMAKEKEHCIARQMIVDGLGSFKDEYVKATLIELLNDEEVAGHAISGLSRMGDKSIIKYIEPFLTYKIKWVRKEAGKAIKKLNK